MGGGVETAAVSPLSGMPAPSGRLTRETLVTWSGKMHGCLLEPPALGLHACGDVRWDFVGLHFATLWFVAVQRFVALCFLAWNLHLGRLVPMIMRMMNGVDGLDNDERLSAGEPLCLVAVVGVHAGK